MFFYSHYRLRPIDPEHIWYIHCHLYAIHPRQLRYTYCNTQAFLSQSLVLFVKIS